MARSLMLHMSARESRRGRQTQERGYAEQKPRADLSERPGASHISEIDPIMD